jgi:hypothetical protein
MNKEMEEYGARGFNIIAHCGEERSKVLACILGKGSAMPAYPIGMGGGRGNMQTTGIPYGWLIGVDGKILWQGNPGSLPKKELEAELKKVGKPTLEQKEERAAAILAQAEKLVGEKRFLHAVQILEKAAKKYAGCESAKKAEAKKKEIEEAADSKPELEAQRALAKMTGGLDLPKEKLKGKEKDALALKIEAFLKSNREKAPATADMAQQWAGVLASIR